MVALLLVGILASMVLPTDSKTEEATREASVDHVLVLKSERKMSLMAHGKVIRTYKVSLGGTPVGAKEQQGDHKTPEGTYVLDRRNPQSKYYKSIHVSYPNEQDKKHAAKLGISPGGDIMIHGSSVSVGCLAMGNETAEDLFVLASDTGLPNVTVIIAPVDFRKGKSVPKVVKLPDWSSILYSQIKVQLNGLPPEEAR